MEFVGLEPFHEVDVEIRTPSGTFDLHNCGELQHIVLRSHLAQVELEWAVASHLVRPTAAATVIITFEDVKALSVEGDLFADSASEDALYLDAFSYVPASNGPRWVQLIFGNDARLTMDAGRCVANVDTKTALAAEVHFG